MQKIKDEKKAVKKTAFFSIYGTHPRAGFNRI